MFRDDNIKFDSRGLKELTDELAYTNSIIESNLDKAKILNIPTKNSKNFHRVAFIMLSITLIGVIYLVVNSINDKQSTKTLEKPTDIEQKLNILLEREPLVIAKEDSKKDDLIASKDNEIARLRQQVELLNTEPKYQAQIAKDTSTGVGSTKIEFTALTQEIKELKNEISKKDEKIAKLMDRVLPPKYHEYDKNRLKIPIYDERVSIGENEEYLYIQYYPAR